MEFANRSGQQPAAPAAAPARATHSGGKKPRGKWLGIVTIILLVSSALLLGALIFTIATSDAKQERSHLDKSKYQAVFLNGGQVYFGKVGDLTKDFLTMENIYYLRVNEQVQPETEGQDQNQQQAAQDISLAKLGCELHGPEDRMVINREQVIFWENLKDDGQVAKAISEFVKQNPDGQKCTEPQAS